MNKIVFICLLISSVFSIQIPIDQTLLQNEYSSIIEFNTSNSNEYLINISASSNTNWSEQGNESATLRVVVNGEQEIYNQDIVLFNGDSIFTYECFLGYLDSGSHNIQFYFDYAKSSLNSDYIYIEQIEIIDISDVNIDSDVFLYSPILYGRNLIEWNESSYTDVPMYMYYDISYSENSKTITYYLIFSNEDSRVGFGLSELMRAYGRTTDIEWIYQISIDNNNNIINEVFQGASHITENFNGNKYFNHPILINATLNCNFSDYGVSDYRFFLSPAHNSIPNHTSEILMDQNPWMYKIMAEELINENRYENDANPITWDLSDVRNYVYIEFEGNVVGDLEELQLGIQFYNDCNVYFNDHNREEIVSNFYGGIDRTAIELPPNFNINAIENLIFNSSGESNYVVEILDIKKLFYLDETYHPIDIPYLDFSIIDISNDNSENFIIINEDNVDIDCSGILYGNAFCDNCGVCSGGETEVVPNIDEDACGVCYGNNENMDCLGECFGNAYEDACGICDDNIENDGLECNAGCTDINAINYNPESVIYDGSCEYSDNIFNVPTEYQVIQNAIYYSSNGDSVLVDSGIYNESINFLGKNISVISLNGPDNTIINGFSDSTSVVTFSHSEGSDALLDGFTISGGYGIGVSFEDFISNAADTDLFEDMIYNDMGSGGILCLESSPRLNNLIIENNTSRNVAGGIGLINSNSIISNSIIRNNVILDGDALGGGGIAINGGSPIFQGLEIYNNIVGSNIYSLSGGGGILCGFPYEGNQINLIGDDIKIYGNSANIGGALGILSGEAKFDRILVINNYGDYGSAISLGEPLGLVVDDIEVNIAKSTITDNQGMITLAMIDNSTLDIVNSIIWNPDAEYEISPLPNNSELNISIFYSDIYSSYEGEGNISFYPNLNDTYHLNEDSPCIDSGISYFEYQGEILSDNVEYYGSNPDMGFYESNYTQLLYGDVNEDGSIDILDVILIADFIIENSLPNNNEFLLSDLNGDNIIDIIDVIQIINIILNS